MRFLFIGSRFTFHASFPHSVTLVQLRFASLTVTSSREDLHLQECAHAGRTSKKPRRITRRGFFWEKRFSVEAESGPFQALGPQALTPLATSAYSSIWLKLRYL